MEGKMKGGYDKRKKRVRRVKADLLCCETQAARRPGDSSLAQKITEGRDWLAAEEAYLEMLRVKRQQKLAEWDADQDPKPLTAT
jgi:hypothetical protein